jgi:hypothetical protein
MKISFLYLEQFSIKLYFSITMVQSKCTVLQDRQRMYNITLRHARATIVADEKQ